MEKEKFKVSVIDFMPFHKKIKVGEYEDKSPAYLGDCVSHNGEENWLISYRYGNIYIKQIGMMAMIGQEEFKVGDFSRVEKTNTFLAGNDWLIIGYKEEPMYKELESHGVQFE